MPVSMYARLQELADKASDLDDVIRNIVQEMRAMSDELLEIKDDEEVDTGVFSRRLMDLVSDLEKVGGDLY